MWEYSYISDEIDDLTKEDFTSDTILQRFKEIRTNWERLDFVYNRIKYRAKFLDIVSKTKIPKCGENSVRYRREGNEMFQQKKLFQALQLYTRSIANANINTSNLAIAYANRSAVLYEKKYFEECLEDITRAFENNYPEHLKEKLLNRQRRAEAQPTRIFDRFHDPIPSFQPANRNPRIDVASKCVKIMRNNRFGQHIVATRDINVGEIIAIEKPYASSVEFDSQFLHCHECLEYCVNMIPCTSCVSALYCGPVCRERAFSSYHKYQCNLMQIAAQAILSVQVVIKAFTEYDNIENNPSYIYFSNRFKEIDALETNQKSISLESLYNHSVFASLCYFSLKNDTSFLSDINVTKRKVKDCLLRHEMITNIHQVEIEKIRPTPIDLFNDLYVRDEAGMRIGRGLYSFSCLFSHACAPNVTYTHYGSVQVTRAICNIKRGEQCYSNYGFPRNVFLRKKWLDILHISNQHLSIYNYVCSDHFNIGDFYVTPTGKRFLKNLLFQQFSSRGPFRFHCLIKKEGTSRKIEGCSLTGTLEKITSDTDTASEAMNFETTDSDALTSKSTDSAESREVGTSTETASEVVDLERTPPKKNMFYATDNVFTRKVSLRENFQFNCQCKACVNYWPPQRYMREGRELPQMFLARLKEQRMLENGAFDIEWGKQLLPDAINIMNALKEYEPCKNFLRIQYFINEIYDYMGNKIVKF